MDRPNYYAIIPANVRYNKNLKPNEKLLYGEITSLCNQKGFCWASNSYFSELYNVTVQTISSWVSNLKKEGYVMVDFIYKGNTKEIEKRCISLPTPITNNLNTPYEKTEYPITKKLKGNTTSINTKIEYKDICTHFEEFYKAYPRKVNKKKAKDKWISKVKSESMYHVVMASLQKQKKSKDWQNDDGQYIPYPTSWLNGERWNDELTPGDENIVDNFEAKVEEVQMSESERQKLMDEINEMRAS